MFTSDIDDLVREMAKKRIEYNRTPKCGNKHFQHAAVIFRGNIKRGCGIMTFGMNLRKEQPYVRTIHAEADALYRLPLRNNKKLQSIHLCVIKTTKTGKLGNSKPCFHCISTLIAEAPKKGYRIEWIFYSKETGEMEKCKLSKFLETHGIFLSSYYKAKIGMPR